MNGKKKEAQVQISQEKLKKILKEDLELDHMDHMEFKDSG